MARQAVNMTINARDRTKRAFETATRNIDGLVRSGGRLDGLFRAAGPLGIGIAAITTAAYGLVRVLTATIDRLDEIDKASRAAGVDGETLQTWRVFGELVGATTSQIDTSLRRIRRRSGEALLGGEVARSFETLGISMQFLSDNSEDVGAIMLEVAKRLATAENRTTAFAAAVRIGDIEFARFAQGLIDSGADLQLLERELREMGAIIPNELLPEVVKAKDEMTKLNKAMETQKDLLVLSLLPAWRLVPEVFRGWRTAIEGIGNLWNDIFDQREDEELLDDIERRWRRYRRVQNILESDVPEERRNALLKEQTEIIAEIIRLTDKLDAARAARSPASPDRQPAPPDEEDTGTPDISVLERAKKLLDAERQQVEVRKAYLRLKREQGDIDEAEYQRQLALLDVKGTAAAREAEGLEQLKATLQTELLRAQQETALVGLKGEELIRQRAIHDLQTLGLRLAKDISDEEREHILLLIRERELRLERELADYRANEAAAERTDALTDQNDLLRDQLDVLSDIGYVLDGFEDSTEGWIRALGQALQIWQRFSAARSGEGTGGVGGLLGSLGGAIGGGGAIPPVPAVALSGGAVAPSGASFTSHVNVAFHGVDYGTDFREKAIEAADVIYAGQQDFIDRNRRLGG